MAQLTETRIYVTEAELKMEANKTVKEWVLMWEVWAKIDSRRETLRWGKRAMSNLHDIDYGRQPILLPWSFPGRQVPGLTSQTSNSPCQWTHHQHFSTQALAKNHHPSSTVRQQIPAPPFPHRQFVSFCKSQLTLPAHDLVPDLHANFMAIRESMFGFSGGSKQGFRSGSSTS